MDTKGSRLIARGSHDAARRFREAHPTRPLVVALTVFSLLFTGDALHQMSVYGMILALGLLIDNAIVMADEVTKRKAKGKSALQAVTESVNHLFLPLLASTLTTIIAFMPIVLLTGTWILNGLGIVWIVQTVRRIRAASNTDAADATR